MPPVDSSATDPDAKTTPASSTEGYEENQDANLDTAESSNADEGAKGPESMFDAVKEVMDKDKAQGEDSPASDEGKDQNGDDEGENPDAQPDEEGKKAEGDENLPFHNHPRWQEMLEENRQLKEHAKAADELMEFTEQSGLSQEELSNGLSIMHLLKTDPYKAREALVPYMEQLDRLTGLGGLPQDLQSEVDAGRITEEHAQALHQSRAKAEFAETRAQHQERLSQQEQQNRQAEQAQAAQNQMRENVTAWENKWKESDPDFNEKQPLVKERVLSLIFEQGPPRTPEQAVEMSKQARDEVEQRLKKFGPARREQKRTVTGGSSVKTTPQPKSLREAINQAANKG